MKKNYGQSEFERHCIKELGSDFQRVLANAQAKFKEAFDSHPIEHQKHNRAMAELNKVFLAELKLIGAEEWRPRPGEEKPPARKIVQHRKPTQEEVDAIAYKPKSSKGTGALNKMLDQIDRERAR